MSERLKPLADQFRDVLTPQELALRGEIEHITGGDFYRPLAVISGLGIENIDRYRQEIGIYLIPEFIAAILNIRNPLVATLEKLNTDTGSTVRDPRILGEWLRDRQFIQEHSGRDLTEELYQALAERRIDLFRRV